MRSCFLGSTSARAYTGIRGQWSFIYSCMNCLNKSLVSVITRVAIEIIQASKFILGAGVACRPRVEGAEVSSKRSELLGREDLLELLTNLIRSIATSLLTIL